MLQPHGRLPHVLNFPCLRNSCAVLRVICGALGTALEVTSIRFLFYTSQSGKNLVDSLTDSHRKNVNRQELRSPTHMLRFSNWLTEVLRTEVVHRIVDINILKKRQLSEDLGLMLIHSSTAPSFWKLTSFCGTRVVRLMQKDCQGIKSWTLRNYSALHSEVTIVGDRDTDD